MVWQHLMNGLCRGLITGMLALGFGFIYYSTGIFHVALGAAYALAAYTVYALYAVAGVGLIVSIAGGLAAAAILGVICDSVVYGPLLRKGASPTVVLISSLGVYLAVVNGIALVAGTDPKVLRPTVERSHRLGPVIVSDVQLAEALVGAVGMAAHLLLLNRTSFGLRCRALADDPDLLSVLGVDQDRLRRWIFAWGSTLAAIGAVMIALDVGIDPEAGMPAVIAASVACIVGGRGRFLAPAVGALVLAVLQALVVWRTSARWQSAVTFVLLIGFLLIRPRGLFGRTERLEEL